MRRFYDHLNKRLIYTGKPSDSKMWEELWDRESIEKLYFPKKFWRPHKTIQKITQKYLKPGSKILEGGCGLGDKVFLLRKVGYKVIGIDYALMSITRAHQFMPNLSLGCGDVRILPFKKDTFDGYWSFGVIEHFPQGYEEIIHEMNRVLCPGGFLFVTVPTLSKLRKIKAKLGLYPAFYQSDIELNDFYQFAYDSQEIICIVERYGFEVIERQGWNAYKGFSDEIPGTRYIMSFLLRYLDGIAWDLLKDFSNHMDLLVFRKGTL